MFSRIVETGIQDDWGEVKRPGKGVLAITQVREKWKCAWREAEPHVSYYRGGHVRDW